ncbi:MAG: hypothetical protein MMC23_004698 [Stictis urceolatum]|nr:hypothetical protein [Stictis urceolata]
MPGKNTGLLDQAYWEEVNPELKNRSPPDLRIAVPTHARRWSIDLIRPALFTPRPRGPSKPLRRTAYLDGLKGFAALLVYWHHHQLWAHDGLVASFIMENVFGYQGRYYLACFHGLRTFFTGGHYAVTTFFVISGYVLSTKPLSLIHAGEQAKLADNVGSALFRRWLRLFIPVICTTFVYMSMWHAFGIWQIPSKPEGKYKDEIWQWYAEFKNFSFIFKQGGDPWFTYNFHTWSIPVEMKGSIVIYTSLLAFSKCTRNARLCLEACLIYYFLYIADGWYCALFMAGMLICDLDLLAESNNLPWIFYKFSTYKDFIFYHIFIVSLYLGGVPSQNADVNQLRESRGWYYLSFLKPQAVFDYKWFYLFFASTFLVISSHRIRWLKRFFETRFCQYLGRICFALYLVHGPVLWTLGDRVYCAVGFVKQEHQENIPDWVNWFPLPRVGPLGLEPAFLLPNLVLLPFTLWIAEIVTKLFDEPAVNIAQWLYRKSLPSQPPLPPPKQQSLGFKD